MAPVHEADVTYTVPARQSLTKPIIGGNAPVTQFLTQQPQFVYVSGQGTNGNGLAARQIFQPTAQLSGLHTLNGGNKLTMYQQEQLLQRQFQQQQQRQLLQPEAQKSNYVQIFTPAP